jgi:uncharacterized protein (DUF1330 family)
MVSGEGSAISPAFSPQGSLVMVGSSRSRVALVLGATLAALCLYGTAQAESAKAYVVALLEVHDTGWIDEYRPKTAALVEKHGGRYIAADFNPSLLEGDHDVPSMLAIVEFPSAAAARAWYDDPELVPLIKLRQTGSHLDLFLAEGLE